nr:MAG TPA: hypothetical protein [Bacteriophage sp.]
MSFFIKYIVLNISSYTKKQGRFLLPCNFFILS